MKSCKKYSFLPVSLKDARRRGWDELDIILVSGDAYVDHPGFGVAIIARVLEDAGYRVGIIAQPDWKSDGDFLRLGKPRLFFAVSSGNVDSMVNNYTANRKIRRSDVYSPGGKGGLRPNRASLVYSNRLRQLYPGVPLLLGGVEASLRRFAHYDYWSDSVRQSILADAPADMLVFGMGERQVVEIAKRVDRGEKVDGIRDVAGTCVKYSLSQWGQSPPGVLSLPGFSEVSTDKNRYAEAFKLHYLAQDPIRGCQISQVHPKCVVVQNKPALPLSQRELDHVYELPYTRLAHPSYGERIPALDTVKFSITSHRGCFASCSFCALAHHQGRIVQSRSEESIIREATLLSKRSDFKGIIQDVGGPTANMYGMSCEQWGVTGACRDKTCLFPEVCKRLDPSHMRQVKLLQQLRRIRGVKHVFVSSGIRYDLVLADKDSDYLEELCLHHVSGQLKIAPEHIVEHVTDSMRKPGRGKYEQFVREYKKINKELGKRQYLVAYLMSSHPGCTVSDMVSLAEYLRDSNRYTEQVQDFTPTPMTLSTCMYYTGFDPLKGEKVYVARGREKSLQRALLQFRDAKNRKLVHEALELAGREELEGNGKKCLIARSGY